MDSAAGLQDMLAPVDPREPGAELFENRIRLRWYQREAVDACIDYLANGEGMAPIITLPTASGKSLVCAELVREILREAPHVGILVLTHRAELIRQNERHLRDYAKLDCAIYGAALGRKDLGQVTFAMMQSFARLSPDKYPTRVWIVVVDEAQLVARRKDTSYVRILARLREAAQREIIVIGLTATPFRADGSGYLWEETSRGVRTFDGQAYEADVGRLIEDGFLVEPRTRNSSPGTAIDTQSLRIARTVDGPEYDLEEQARQIESKVRQIASEIRNHGRNRRKWMVFAPTKRIAELVNAELAGAGVSTTTIFDETPERERERIYASLRDTTDPLRCVVGCTVLSTGFDCPPADLLAILRATMSPVLYVQMVGRVMRICKGKDDALVLDFGGNAERHGAIDDLRIHRTGLAREAPARVCPECLTHARTNDRVCTECGYVWPAPEARDELARVSAQADAPYESLVKGKRTSKGRNLGEFASEVLGESAGRQLSLLDDPTRPMHHGKKPIGDDEGTRDAERAEDHARIDRARWTALNRTARDIDSEGPDETELPEGVWAFDVKSTEFRFHPGREGRPAWFELVYRDENRRKAYERFWPESSPRARNHWRFRRRWLGDTVCADTAEQSRRQWKTWRKARRVWVHDKGRGPQVVAKIMDDDERAMVVHGAPGAEPDLFASATQSVW